MLRKKTLFADILCLFFCLLPLIEIYKTFLGDSFDILGFAAEEFITMLFAGTIFVLAGIIAVIEKRKVLIFSAVGFFAVFAIFLVLHGMNVLKFNTAIFNTAKPNFIVECYYLVRMYALPFAVGFSAVALSPDKKKILLTLKIVATEICAVIIATTLIGNSFVSYSDELRKVDGGFFSWFSIPENSNYAFYTAKGFFPSANQIGALMFALSPFMVYDAIKNKSVSGRILTVTLGLSMIMLGTKVASVGFLLALFAVFGIFFVEKLIKKSWKEIVIEGIFTVVIAALYTVLLLNSPGYKMQKHNYVVKNTDHRDTNIVEIGDIIENASSEEEYVWSEEEIRKMEDYMEKKHYYHYVNEWFLKIYPVRNDMAFWTNIATRDNTLNQSNRDFKIDIVARIVSRNKNPLDKYFGIGYTSSVPYTERDYVYQYDLYGLSGMAVLILPFFVSLALSGITAVILLIRKKSFSFTATAMVALGTYLFTAYFAGHVFDILINMYFISFIASVPFIRLSRKNNEE